MEHPRIVGYRLMRRLRKTERASASDDFNWEIYNGHYRGELATIERDHTLVLEPGDYVQQGAFLEKRNASILPLHPNHHLLYETIALLEPESIFELGCGGGDHLSNLSVLLPHSRLSGVDLSSAQVALLRERHPGLKADIRQFDATLPFPLDASMADVGFTQAVLMHMQTGNGHLVALANLFRTARRQVILMENWLRHHFLDDIRHLHQLRVIPWPRVFFYYRVSAQQHGPRLMIASSVELPGLSPLDDFATLRADA